MSNMTTDEVLDLVSRELVIKRELLSIDSKAADFPSAWDSMGTMNLMLALDADYSVKLAPGQTEKLQSVRGLMELLGVR